MIPSDSDGQMESAIPLPPADLLPSHWATGNAAFPQLPFGAPKAVDVSFPPVSSACLTGFELLNRLDAC